jgi:serine/threonine-protein kinase PknK
VSSPKELTSSLAAGGLFGDLEAVGTGGSAEVLKARHRASGQAVALKLAHSVELGAALAREAEAAALALSPRLPELVDAGWLAASGGEPPRAFLALRWVPGRPALPHRATSASERLARALVVARDVGEALAALHAVGLAHGDVKPANILLDEDGHAHLIDLGLAGPAAAESLLGGTPRYLARSDATLGDARARDLLAFGIVLAELTSPKVAESDEPLEAARRATLPAPIDAIAAALLAPSPGARPSALWVRDAAADFAGTGSEAEQAAARQEANARTERQIHGTYLRLRRHELATAGGAGPGTVEWLGEAVARARRARRLAESPYGGGARQGVEERPAGPLLDPLPPEGRARWLASLAGSAVASWPFGALASVPEDAFGRALVALGAEVAPSAWTFALVEAAVAGARPPAPAAPLPLRTRGELDPEAVARVAMELGKVPPTELAILAVERERAAPEALVLGAAAALRHGGELGRARSLVLAQPPSSRAGRALAAEVLRRAGDGGRATALAEPLLASDDEASRSARATLARIAADAGRTDEALALAGEGGASAALAEVRALLRSLAGEREAALDEVERGLALARTAEERARLAGMRGYVTHEHDPAGSLMAYREAADEAARAGAVIEEATYRTGLASAAVDVGEIAVALDAGRRAALLWEHLGRPAHAARARLALAAAFATVGAQVEAERAAHEAAQCAREAGDARAEAFACWAVTDASAARSADALASALRAAALLGGGSAEDELRAAARLVRHAHEALPRARVAGWDELAASPSMGAAARLEWWAARGETWLRQPEGERCDELLAALTSLADVRAPLAARGPALAVGVELAIRAGRSDVAQRLLAALRDVSRTLLAGAPPELQESARALPWVNRARAETSGPSVGPERALEIQRIVHALSERQHLGALLREVVDTLVLWTGVERGLLLMRAPDGHLVPRAARNLARADLVGEQLTLSRSLAQRALETREVVVAVDAAGELGSTHHSVHVLKLRSVLALPLVARGESLGVVYLDDRVRRGAFGPADLAFARTIADLAAVAIADARDQVLLRRAARRARRASEALATTLASRDAALDVAERELARVREGRPTRFRYERIVGESEPICAMLRLVDRVTLADVPVLVLGESGSGKELVARAIHDNGPRKGRPFVGENCGAIPEPLLESALFGHVRGAFTGADRPRAGLFEVADTGTLFLDEIGEMTLGMQTKLLRVLEDGLVKPVGGERARRVDVRIIAATHRDLPAMVAARTFREDLYYRLDIVTVRVPPLRERPADVPLLVRHFLGAHAAGKDVTVTPAAMQRLMACPWPGNVRQLENELRRAIVLSDGTIDRAHLSPEIAERRDGAATPLGLHVRKRVDALEAELVREALRQTRSNQTQAAKLLGLSRFGLQKMMKRLGVD